MAPYFSSFQYFPVEVDDRLPESVRGIVFANEFFDALPVDLAVRRGPLFHHMRVGWNGRSFEWVESEELQGARRDYLVRYAGDAVDGALIEVQLEASRWMDAIGGMVAAGHVLIVDYGYSRREVARFPGGTLMSYSRHRAIEDVLAEPGRRDITSHVCFAAIEDAAIRNGLEKVRYESLSQTLLRIGERDGFAFLLDGVNERERNRRRLQLKTLLFGMGEVFRVLLLEKKAHTK
jgi:SAM-dependent MidA family methyltransferase